jgi:hypothetical protein
VDFCLDLADRVYVLEKGRIRYEGTTASCREGESVASGFWGLLGRLWHRAAGGSWAGQRLRMGDYVKGRPI